MKKNIVSTITLAILCLFIGFSSIAITETSTSATSSEEQMVVTLPEIVCTAEKAPEIPKISYKEYLNQAMESIRESLERIQLKNIMEEVKSIIRQNGI